MAGPSQWSAGNKSSGDGDSKSWLNSVHEAGLSSDPVWPMASPLPPAPSSNPHAGYHPSSFGPDVPFTAAALGASSSNGSASLGMSISPPHWVAGNTLAGTPGSFGGSLGAMGTSFGRERDRELEAKYVKDFQCCGKELDGLHELLEHYEEYHANLAPDIRMAAIVAAKSGFSPSAMHSRLQTPQNALTDGGSLVVTPPHTSAGSFQHQHQDDAPTPPGMMDIEMEDSRSATSAFFHMPQQSPARSSGYKTSSPQSPWATAFRPSGSSTPQQGVTPSLLSIASPNHMTQSGSLTPEHDAKSVQKRKAERSAVREEASTSDLEGEKKFLCPIAGCGKVYKQANGLKYHLTRSINSGHGNVAALGGLSALLGIKDSEAEGWSGKERDELR